MVDRPLCSLDYGEIERNFLTFPREKVTFLQLPMGPLLELQTMYWTEIYEWEPEEDVNPSVYQQVGFLSWAAREQFLEKLPNYQQTASGSRAENGLGAFVKLRAVRQSDGGWQAVVRCGVTGTEIENSALENPFATPDLAIARAQELFVDLVTAAAAANL